MRNTTSIRLTVITLSCLLLLSSQAAAIDPLQSSDQVGRISVSELLRLIEEKPVVIVDARIERAWKRAGNKIPGAIRLDTPEKIAHFTKVTDPQRAIVVYCL